MAKVTWGQLRGGGGVANGICVGLLLRKPLALISNRVVFVTICGNIGHVEEPICDHLLVVISGWLRGSSKWLYFSLVMPNNQPKSNHTEPYLPRLALSRPETVQETNGPGRCNHPNIKPPAVLVNF
jgi:hypothetical protein